MRIRLIVKKLEMRENKFITRDELLSYGKSRLEYYTLIRYLTHYGYLIRIMKGIFYVRSIEERKLKKTEISPMAAIKEALKIKGVKNWYFGLETAVKLNHLTHEYYTTDFIINDHIFRAKPISIMGRKVKFIKIKPSLTTFGIVKKGVPYSNSEKTLLDFLYLNGYRTKRNIPAELVESCSKAKVNAYAKRYGQKIKEKLRGLL